MKKTYNVMMLAAVAAVALVSCAKEMDSPEAAPAEEGIKVLMVADTPATKTEITGTTSSKATVGWRSGDKIDLVNSANDEKATSGAAVISEGKAQFTATVAAAGTFYAYYPTSSRALVNHHGEVKILETQYPAGADTFDPATDVLVSEEFEVGAAGSYETNPTSLRFKRLGAFIRVQFVDNTTGSLLGSEHASSVAIQSDGEGKIQLVGKMEISPDGIENFTRYNYKVTANYEADVFDFDDSFAYFGVLPNTLVEGSKLIFTATTENYQISKTVTLSKDIVYNSGDILPLQVNISDGNLVTKVQRVWGKYSTNEAYWNAYFSGTAGSDRNIAMDDEYIYLPETTAAAKMWKIPLDGTTAPSLVNVEGVSGGTHALSCVRIIPNKAAGVNGGKDFLMASNLTINSSSAALTVYSWSNGTANAPVSESVSNGRCLRIGDKFSVYGSLQDGALFFRNWNGTDDWGGKGTILVLRMAWSAAPSGGYFNPRITLSYEDSGINAYYPYPGDASNGFIANVSAASQFASYGSSPLSTSPNSSGTFTASSGYYSNTAGFNYIEYRGKRYVAYVKNAGDGDGRFYVLQGETTDSWADILGSKRKVIYQADIQQNLAYADGEYHEDLSTGVTKTSANSALDCTARIIGDEVYFAALKQGVGLSLFKLSLN